jgi:hypothetical protein
MWHVGRMLTNASKRVSHLLTWGEISSKREVRATAPRRPLLPTFAWFMITGALADLTIVVSLVFDLRVGVLALLCCLAAATITVRSPYRWRRWHESRNGKDTSSQGFTNGPGPE